MRRRRAEPSWLTRTVVDAIHTDQLREHGGLLGLRDENGLESALARPQQRWHFDGASDLAAFGAAYAFGIARNHPYNDGYKRVALVAMLTFLATNGFDFEAEDDDVLTTMLALLAGRLTETEFAVWVRTRLVPIK
jgi:death on curing protein